jgi:hypothetical protein
MVVLARVIPPPALAFLKAGNQGDVLPVFVLVVKVLSSIFGESPVHY